MTFISLLSKYSDRISIPAGRTCGASQIRFRLNLRVLLAILFATVSFAHHGAAQNRIDVTTTQQGVTDPSHYSLQEAMYSVEFGAAVAIGSTDPDLQNRCGAGH